MPVVVLGTDTFAPLARAAAAALGMPHLPLATVPHPIGGLEPAAVRRKADAIVDVVLAALTEEPPLPGGAASAHPARVEAPDDVDAFQEFALAQGWGDGLPVLPPTPERVDRIVAGYRGRRDDLVATLPPRRGQATVGAIAVNAALAGAGPEHVPVVVAAIRAVAEPRFNLEAVQATTHPCTPLLIVNGPIVTRLGISAGAGALGSGHRANAVIGRAVRLVLQNVGGARPGREDRATLGQPGKFTYCLAENVAASPWPPLSVERGFGVEESCVTVCAAEAPHNVNDHGSTSADGLLAALAGTAATTGNNNVYLGGEPLVVLGPEHAATLAAGGWSKADLKRAFWERARVPLSAFSAENLARLAVLAPDRFREPSADARVPLATSPDDVMVIVAGGPGKHSAVIPTFGATRAVTAGIEA